MHPCALFHHCLHGLKDLPATLRYEGACDNVGPIRKMYALKRTCCWAELPNVALKVALEPTAICRRESSAADGLD